MDKVAALSVPDTENANDNSDDNNIIFTIKDTKVYIPVVRFSARDNKKLSKLFSKVFEIYHFIGINIKQKVIIKIRETDLDIFSDQIV